MPKSLELSAYRALVRRNLPTKYTPTQDRPVGEILWLNRNFENFHHLTPYTTLAGSETLALDWVLARVGLVVL